MKISIGILLVTIPYSYQRGKIIYYQRAIPEDLQERCASKRVKIRLDTESVRLAARLIEKINRAVEAEWKALRSSPDVAPKTIKGQAEDFLREWGLSPSAPAHDEDAAYLFHDYLDQKRGRHAGGNEKIYRQADPSEYLMRHEIEAAKILGGTAKPRITDALELYLKVHQKRTNEKFCSFARNSFAKLVEAVGDKPIEEVSRDDGHLFVTKMLQRGLASASVEGFSALHQQ